MFAGEDGGAGGAADGVSTKGVAEHHAFFGEAVDVRGGCHLFVTASIS